MIVKQVLVYFNGGSKASLNSIFRDSWEKFENRFGLSKHLKKHRAPHRHYTQAASIESVNLRRLVGVARSPLWRGAQLEEIGQIGLKPALYLW